MRTILNPGHLRQRKWLPDRRIERWRLESGLTQTPILLKGSKVSNEQCLQITLRDDFDSDNGESDAKLPVKIIASEDGIYVSAEGYGDCQTKPGHGVPVWLELYEGKLVLHVWADINREEPTHSIDLTGAREDQRAPYLEGE